MNPLILFFQHAVSTMLTLVPDLLAFLKPLLNVPVRIKLSVVANLPGNKDPLLTIEGSGIVGTAGISVDGLPTVTTSTVDASTVKL